MPCEICPRKCLPDRSRAHGFCGMGILPVVAKACLHHWEEPCISGSRGSGTVFFSGCNLKCVYCQNYRISQENFGKEISIRQLGEIFLALQEKGAHNINLVNPSHFVPQIRECLMHLPELAIPVVYNTNGYETVDTLKSMESFIDVYLPDIKYWSGDISRKYSSAGDYFDIACKAVLEMYRQVGAPVYDEQGMIKKGLMVRHLILPGHTGESVKILEWIRENLPGSVSVSLMSQYTPCYKAESYPEINRRITRREYEKVVNYFLKLGFENGYIQERESSDSQYIPEFDLMGVELGNPHEIKAKKE